MAEETDFEWARKQAKRYHLDRIRTLIEREAEIDDILAAVEDYAVRFRDTPRLEDIYSH